MSILESVKLGNTSSLSENDDIFVAQFSSFSQFRGLYEFSRIASRFKLVVFYDESLPASAIYKLNNFPNIITCKFSKASSLYRYIPIIKSDLKFNNAYICDIGLSRFYWRQTILAFEQVIKTQSKYNTYLLPLAGELIQENLDLEAKFNLQSWHRLSKDHLIIKKDNEFPTEILDETFNNNESDEVLMMRMMQYIQDNQITFHYQVLIFGNRIPFYYWLEHVKPSEDKKTEFMTKMGSTGQTIENYLKIYEYQKRKELYVMIQRKFGDYSFFEDQRLIKCIRRINTYFRNDDHLVYCKKW